MFWSLYWEVGAYVESWVEMRTVRAMTLSILEPMCTSVAHWRDALCDTLSMKASSAIFGLVGVFLAGEAAAEVVVNQDQAPPISVPT